MTKFLVLGDSGLLGQSICAYARELGHEVFGVSRRSNDIRLDLTDASSLRNILSRLKPNVVVNAAANINLTNCENTWINAWEINTRIVAIIVEWCKSANTKFVQISTDHFFDAKPGQLSSETAEVVIKNEYARSKYVAELIALSHKRSLVLRTSILGFRGWEEKTLVEFFLKSLLNSVPINVYQNVYTSSIPVSILSEKIIELLNRDVFGLINVGATASFSKADLYFELSNQLGKKVEATKVVNLKGDPLRLNNLGLDVTLLEKLTEKQMPRLNEIVEILIREGKDRGFI